jgi:hypothetical protein
MQEHLKAECDLYHAAFVTKDAGVAHAANIRAVSLIQLSAQLKIKAEAHRRAEHDDGTAVWNVPAKTADAD